MFCTFNLTAALAALKAAEDAKKDFLKALDLDKNPETATTADNVKDLIDATKAGPVKTFNDSDLTPVTLAATSTTAEQAAAFAAARALADAKISEAQANEVAKKALINATIATDAEIAAYEAAKKALADAEKVTAAAKNTLTDAVAAFEFGAVSIAADAKLGADLANWTGVTYDHDKDDKNENGQTDVTEADETPAAATAQQPLIAISSTPGVFKVADAVVTAGTAADASAEAKAVLAGAQSILAAYQAAYNAFKAEVAADTALATATNALGDQQGVVDTYLTAKAATNTAVENKATLEGQIQKVVEAYTLNAQLKTLEDAIKAANKVLTDADWNVSPLTGNVDADDDDYENDVFLFDKNAAVIDSFGEEGTDVLFFGSKSYTLVKLADDFTTFEGKSIGNVGVLEIFWKETGGNLDLYVELESFAGNASGADDIVKITLTGFTAAEITNFTGNMLVG